MPKHDQYHIDYKKLYPGIENRPEILKVLAQSDRKMKYMEYDLKTEQPHCSKETGNCVTLLTREDSLERLKEEEPGRLLRISDSPEEILLRKMRYALLLEMLKLLSQEEQSLIYRRYWLEKTQCAIAAEDGISQ